jgi:succinoglycan biosynthesis transport protein ExoP
MQMELKELLNTVRRWAWLMALGLLVGLLGGYLVSHYMEPVYEVSTKLMISRSIQDENPDLAGLNSQQLVQTYVQISKTKPLLDTTMEKAGVKVASDQISVHQIPDTQIVEIRIDDSNPDTAALVANTMVQVLIDRNKEIQTSQYNALEDRLSKQVEQVKTQIDDLQAEYDQAYGLDYQDQLSKVDNQITEIQTELASLQVEMDALKPAYNSNDRILMAEKQTRVDQLQSLYVTYEQIRANLIVLGKPIQSGNVGASPRLQQLQSTLDLYQKLNLTLVGDLENARLSRLQQTPNLVQIEEAVVPDKPVRPIPPLYTLLGGMIGFMLATGVVFFIGILQSDQKISDEVIDAVSESNDEKTIPAKKKVARAVKTVKAG